MKAEKRMSSEWNLTRTEVAASKIEGDRDVNNYLANTTNYLGHNCYIALNRLVFNTRLLKRFGCLVESLINMRNKYVVILTVKNIKGTIAFAHQLPLELSHLRVDVQRPIRLYSIETLSIIPSVFIGQATPLILQR
jgi:hypothetical protein